MKKIAIITLYGNFNYGNKLQNYALQTAIKRIDNYRVETLINYPMQIKGYKYLVNRFKKFIKNHILSIFSLKYKQEYKRHIRFINFDKNINKYKKIQFVDCPHRNLKHYFDFFVVGSDQVWNPTFDVPKNKIKSIYLLDFEPNNHKKIAYSASFGVDVLPEESKIQVKKFISKFNNISVRETMGKNIVEELTKRKDIEVLIDPTMLLTSDEWDKVSKKPTMLKSDKFILNYFLGDLSFERKKEIDRVAKENNCEVINILDTNNPFYECGPSEFLYLEKHAFLICTDSFHSSVFGILYNTPFLVYEREDRTISMNSRLETLLTKFNLEDRKYTGKIREKDLSIDCTNAYKILEIERKKSNVFLKKAFEIKDSE